MVGLAGVTAMEASAAGPTVRVVEPVTEPLVAETAVVPVATAAAMPPAVEVPVAMNCWVVPLAMVGLAGVTAMEVRATGGRTERTVLPTTVPLAADITDVPAPKAVARPPEVMVAAAVLDDDHVTEDVRTAV